MNKQKTEDIALVLFFSILFIHVEGMQLQVHCTAKHSSKQWGAAQSQSVLRKGGYTDGRWAEGSVGQPEVIQSEFGTEW